MRTVILGPGGVGERVAESLVSERNDITIVDRDARRLRDLEDRMDLRGVAANAIVGFTLLLLSGLDLITAAMLPGRLELLSVPVLFTAQFWRK